jgi:hypothetical protein
VYAGRSVDSAHVPSAEEARRTIDQLNELTGWTVSLREITETGRIIVDAARPADDASSSTESEDRRLTGAVFANVT